MDSLFQKGKSDALSGNLSSAYAVLEELKSIEDGAKVEILKLRLTAFLYYVSEDYERATISMKQELELLEQEGDIIRLAQSTSNVSTIFHRQGLVDSALVYQRLAIKRASNLGDSVLLSGLLKGMFPIQLEKKQFDSAEYFLTQAIDFNTDLVFNNRMRMNLGYAFEKQGMFEKAIDEYSKGLAISIQNEDSTGIALALNNLAYCNFHAGNFEEAFDYLDSNITIENRIKKNEYAESVRELELKYEDLERDAALKDLTFQTERDQNFKILVGSVAVMLAISLISLLLFFNNRLKSQQMLREEETKRFQKEKELASVNASLKAIDQERQRVAMDLHDGIGVLASTAKLWVSQVNKRVEGENLKEILNETNDVLNEITSDVKRIAHNMMPSSLNKLGLKMALEEMVEQLGTATSIAIEADIEDIEFVKDSGSDIMMYRLAQELLNNGVKHSEANHIRLCLSSDKNGVTLAYEDDGKGLGDAGQGNGLNTMRSRAEFMQGTMSIDDKRTKGTHISIVVPHA